MKQLTAAGIRTQMRVDPVLPGLTDDERTFEGLCRAARDAGVREMAASVLFLRPALMRTLRQASVATAEVGRCLAPFANSQRLAIHAERSFVTALPAREREQILQRLERVAAGHGITVKRCACKNPDLASGSCSLAGAFRSERPMVESSLFHRPQAF
jgi:DNA repair photolyase